jgi:hypothetical protein
MIQSLDGQRIAFQPLPRQRVALACPAQELLFGGSKGGGKSHFLVACVLPILELAQRKFEETGQPQKKCRIMVFRKNLEDVKDLISKTFEIYPAWDAAMGADGWHAKEKFWQFTSGATFECRHLDGPTDHEGYNGNEFVALLFDEVQFISYEAYSFLVAQVRSSDVDYRGALMVRCTANPGGPYGDWVKKHFFIDECPDGGKIFELKTKLPDGREITTTRAFVRSYLRDNPKLDPDGTYEARLRSMMSPDEVRMYMEGDFNVVAGAFFSHLLKPQLHFVKSKPIPSTWDMIFGIDWGASAPACCLWAARDSDNRVHVIDELHQPGITGRVFGEAMATKYKHQKWSRERVWKVDDFWGVIDTQAMDRYGSESTAAAGIMEWRFRIGGADKLPGERKVGINQLKERLLLDRQSQPQIVIYEDRCPNLVKALKSVSSRAPEDPDDYDPRSPYAHAVDALRFILMKWPVHAVTEVNPIDSEVARWDALMRRQQQRREETGDRMVSGYGD